MNNTTTLTETVKALYSINNQYTVKGILEAIQTQYSYLKADYRKVYNTLKRINGSSKPVKVSKTSKKEKTSIVFDLTAPAISSVKGIVFKRGSYC